MTTFAQVSIAHQIDEINNLRAARNDWEVDAFATSNEMLYSILGTIYDKYLLVKGQPDLINMLKTGICKANDKLKFRSNNPHIIDVIVKHVFADDGSEKRRISTYTRALKIADMWKTPTGTLPQFLKNSGGIEEVTRKEANSEPRMTEAERIKSMKELVSQMDEHGAKPKYVLDHPMIDPSEYDNLAGSFMTILGRIKPDGKIEVFDLSFEVEHGHMSKEKAAGSSLVNKAIDQFYKAEHFGLSHDLKRKIEKNVGEKEFLEVTGEEYEDDGKSGEVSVFLSAENDTPVVPLLPNPNGSNDAPNAPIH